MKKFMRGSAATIAILLTAPASAKEGTNNWLHEASGIFIPIEVDGIKAPPPESLKNDLDRVIHYGSGGETISLYIFRATYPNAALWFERAEAILGLIWKPKGLTSASEISPVSLGGSGQANGLSHIYTVNSGKTTTAVAVAQVGGWIVKVRSTSNSLDVAGQKARMELIYSKITSNSRSATPFPLKLPDPCSSVTELASKEHTSRFVVPSDQTVMMAGLIGVAHVAEVSGGDDSLAAKPEAYCRTVPKEVEQPYATIYRRRDKLEEGWIALLADSGRSLTTVQLPKLDKDIDAPTALVFANSLDKSHAIVASKGVASAEALIMPALNMLQNGGSGFATTTYDGKNIGVNLPKN